MHRGGAYTRGSALAWCIFPEDIDHHRGVDVALVR